MATSSDETASGDAESNGVEQIADPDNYNTRRRLKQLHDSKEQVRILKNEILDAQARSNRGFDMQLNERNLAEMLSDYVLELRPVLNQLEREDEFLEELVEDIEGDEITLGLYQQRVWYKDGNDPPSIRTTMRAWDVCNDYLEEVAGAMFEGSGLPREMGFDSTEV